MGILAFTTRCIPTYPCIIHPSNLCGTLKANRLMSKMSGEKDRWEHQVAEIQRDAALLSTHTCLSAAYCTYLGHFSEDVRQQAVNMGEHATCPFLLKCFAFVKTPKSIQIQ